MAPIIFCGFLWSYSSFLGLLDGVLLPFLPVLVVVLVCVGLLLVEVGVSFVVGIQMPNDN